MRITQMILRKFGIATALILILTFSCYAVDIANLETTYNHFTNQFDYVWSVTGLGTATGLVGHMEPYFLRLDATNDPLTDDLYFSASKGITDTDGDTKIQLEEEADDDTIRFDTAGHERLTIDEEGLLRHAIPSYTGSSASGMSLDYSFGSLQTDELLAPNFEGLCFSMVGTKVGGGTKYIKNIWGIHGNAYLGTLGNLVEDVIGVTGHANKTGGTTSASNKFIGVKGEITNAASIEKAISLMGSIDIVADVTDYYGLFLKTKTGAGNITNNYGLYQEDANASNYLAGDLTVGGSSAGQSIIASGLVVNEDGLATAADDFRAETDTVTDALEVDASANQVNINTDFQIQPEVDSTTAIQVLDTDGGTPILNIDTANERVGIGTASPQSILHISGTTSKSVILNATESVSGTGMPLDFRYDTGTSSRLIARILPYMTIPGGGHLYLQTSPDNDGPYETRIAILKDGKVGIGTAAPTYKLDVEGSIGVDDYIYHNADADTYIAYDLDRVRVYAGAEQLIDLYEGAQDYVKLGDGGDVDINLNNGMFIEGNSNKVGIGTITPDTTLDIAGSFSFTPDRQEITAATDTINPEKGALIHLDPNANYTLTSTPTIEVGVSGQILLITCPAREENTVRLQDEGTHAGSTLELGAATRTIAELAILTLLWDGEKWVEISFQAN